MISFSPLFANEVISCVAEGRDPSAEEVSIVARRIWGDSGSERSAFAWGKLQTTAPDRLWALGAARVALYGGRT